MGTLSIRSKLLIGFGVVALILLVAVSAILLLVEQVEKNTNNVINVDLPIYDRLLDLGGQVNKSQQLTFESLVLNNQSVKSSFNSTWNNIYRNIQMIDKFGVTWTSNENIIKWIDIKNILTTLKDQEEKIINQSATDHQSETMRSLLLDINSLSNKIFDNLDGPINSNGERVGGLFDEQYQLLNKGTQYITSSLFTMRMIEYILIGIIILVSIIVCIITANIIVKPLNEAISIAKDISNGARDINIKVKSDDETGQLLTALAAMQLSIKENELKIQQSEAQAKDLFNNIVQTAKMFSTYSSKVASGDFRERLEIHNEDLMTQLGTDLNTMTESLANITKQITTACQNMVTTLEEVKQSANIQSSGASEQASSINQITSSLEEIEKSSTQTMDKAKTLGLAAERTREKGQLGLEAVEQSIQGMKTVRDKVQLIAQTILDLSNQTQQVGEITAVVNTLAQQSKMLALNASIEAAKAGEAGKGFAVVASEVKNLAEQSEQSTAQVQKILEDIRHATEKAVMVTEEGTKGVDHGTGLVEQTGEIVRNLTDVIYETTVASQQIEAAVKQESVGIEQITAGMNEINQVTTSFVASANQTMEAIQNLANIAKNLKEHVDTYKI